MRSASSFDTIGPRLPVIIAILAGLALTLLIGIAIGESDFIQVYLVFFTVGAVVAILALGPRYWIHYSNRLLL